MPTDEKLSRFVEAVRTSGLLKGADLESLAGAAAIPDVDPESLIGDLVKRGLLTRYQARRLWKGEGAGLFLSQYVLLDKLGDGGMGSVFRARHTRMDREVALKVMKPEKLANPEAVRRFHREIRAAATLSHENVVMAFDADQAGDVHFFAMEFVDGTTLDRYVRQNGPLPVPEACEYVRQAALGLQHAHEKGLIHRDIKPGNLLLSKSGVVKISDLGLVLVDQRTGPAASRITGQGFTVGTPDFLAPEQARNPRGADIRADIYSLGCTFYYLLTGEFPYPHGTPTQKILQHSREPMPMPARDDVPAGVKAVLTKMTAKKPEKRYATPAAVAAALAPYAAKKGAPAPANPPPIVEELLTDEELPSAETKTDSRFRLSPSEVAPRAQGKKGCLSAVLLVVGAGVIGAVVKWAYA
jgi:eukaryotic-like serine/threonine-protein kinase